MAAATTSTRTKQSPKPFRKGDKVIATTDIGPIPEGTAGVVKMSAGLTWPRYWVAWDGDFDKWTGSVSEDLLVRTGEWDDFKRRREEERNRPPEPKTVDADAASGAGAGAAEGASDAGASGNAASKVPAHLLERSKAARARRGAGGS